MLFLEIIVRFEQKLFSIAGQRNLRFRFCLVCFLHVLIKFGLNRYLVELRVALLGALSCERLGAMDLDSNWTEPELVPT